MPIAFPRVGPLDSSGAYKTASQLSQKPDFAQELAQKGLEMPPESYSSVSLARDLRDARGSLGENLGEAEAVWLAAMATHPSASGGVRAMVCEIADAMTWSQALKNSPFAQLIDSVRPTLDSGPSAAEPGAPSAAQPIATSPAVPHSDVVPSSSVLTGAQPAVGKGWYKQTSVVADPQKAKLFDHQSPLKIAGIPGYDITIKADSLHEKYGGATEKEFGRIRFEFGGKECWTSDLAYNVGTDESPEFGVRIIPVSDEKTITIDGDEMAGFKVLDDYMRKVDGLAPDEPVYAWLSYQHPETWNTPDPKTLATNSLGTELRQTHAGGYRGEGVTFNTPTDYHNSQFEIKGYPSTAIGFQVDTWDKADLNNNTLLAATALNFGAMFPEDYKNDIYRTVDINTALFFYDQWLRAQTGDMEAANAVFFDDSWATYCAEHQAIVATIGMNVEHSLEGFKKTFGEEDGADLWTRFKDVYKQAEGKVFDEETQALPADPARKTLWELEGLTQAEIRPWDSLEEYNAYDDSLVQGAPPYSGFRPAPVGAAMPFPPETTADLIRDFLVSYTPWKDATAVGSISLTLAFQEVAEQRNGVKLDEYMKLVTPIFQKLVAAEMLAAPEGTPPQMVEESIKAGLKESLGEKYAAIEAIEIGGHGLLDVWMQEARGVTPKGTPREEVSEWLHRMLKDPLDQARNTPVSDKNKLRYNLPPAVPQRVIDGLVPGNPHVQIYPYGTVMDTSELDISKADS